MPYDEQTSRPAYNEVLISVEKKRQIVFSVIRKIGPCTDRQIADYLGWTINRITPRRGELVTSGLVYSVVKKPDPNTGITVNYWAVKPVITQSEMF